MVDSHTHLDLLEQEPANAIKAATDAGVTRLLTVGTDDRSCRRALALADQFEAVYCAVGRHPNLADGYDERVTDELRTLAQHRKCRAIGETGLDFYRQGASSRSQLTAFHAQIALAGELALPLIIHTRAATVQTLELLESHAQTLTVILHCFSMPLELDRCLQNGWYISFAGNVTYPKNCDLATAADRVPLERLLVETDAPYLTPQPVRKHRNQPAFVAHTANFLAQRRGIDADAFSNAIDATAQRLFAW